MTAFPPKNLKHIFFDLDHTLWDFDRASSETLSELYNENELGKFSFSLGEFTQAFMKSNFGLWHQFDLGNVDKEGIRTYRLLMVMEYLGVEAKDLFQSIGIEYVKRCPRKTCNMPHTEEVLETLKAAGYTMHVLTNGFDENQMTKLQSGKIDHYFDQLITSDSAKARKPDKAIFDHSLRVANAKAEESLMVGDKYQADVLGAKTVNMAAVLYPSSESAAPTDDTPVIKSLLELPTLLGH